ncbi:MAG: c-type cytochrome [Betaproteobacteria bacterium]|nr:c-type cytochrome [Betaproteobacteria bacterium]
MTEEHSSPIKTPTQLVIVVLLAFAVPIALAVMLSQLVTSGAKGMHDNDNLVLARIQPVGTVVLAEASGPKGMATGEQVYSQVCKTCHETGLAGSPKVGDKAAWGKIVAQGEKLAFEHAIGGIRAMPARGGNPDLTDDEVKRAVAFMVGKVGTTWAAPVVAAAPAATAAPAAERTGQQVVAAACGKCHETGAGGAPKIGDRAAWIQRAKLGLNAVYQSALKGHAGMPARGGMAELSDPEVKRAVEFMMNSGAGTPVAAAAAAPVAAAPAPAAADGKKIYDASCVACHGAGVAGAPKFGDKAAWAPRIKTGMDALYTAVLKGKGVMPAKGGNPSLSDADVKAAVDYMVAAAK